MQRIIKDDSLSSLIRINLKNKSEILIVARSLTTKTNLDLLYLLVFSL